MADLGKDTTISDSAISGDVHIGDVNHNINTTNITNSTNIESPNYDEISTSIEKITQSAFDFVKGIISRALLFATVTVLVFGFLIYSGSIDVSKLLK